MTLRYAIVDTAAGTVINVVEYEAPPGDPPPGFDAGIIAVQSDLADPRWTWDGTQLVPPVLEPVEATPATMDLASIRLDAGITAAVTTVVAAAAAIHAIPHSGAVPARFEALLVQMNVLADAFVAMLQAQQNPPQ
jgi:hypothetical protein